MLGHVILALSLAGTTAVAPPQMGQSIYNEHRPRSVFERDAMAEFDTRVQEYVRLRDDIARDLPPQRVTSDPEELLAARDSLLHAVQRARRDIQPGSMFSGRPAVAFRHLFDTIAATRQVDLNQMVRILRLERSSGAERPVVNEPYDWRLGAWMWPWLLAELPALPPDLQYRVVETDLVLIDIRAGLVIDILEQALPVDEE
jgi:hypothetical protein